MSKISVKSLLESSQKSQVRSWLANFLLHRVVPFNKPHGLKVAELGDYSLKVNLPYQKRNLNHIRGMHACALATLGEYTSGLLLLYHLDPKKYRLILQEIRGEYLYQCKTDAIGKCEVSEDWLEKHAIGPLRDSEKTSLDCKTHIFDSNGNEVAIITTQWQLKDWAKVRTK